MTTYTFQPTTSADFESWDDPMRWSGGVMPNAADADVVLPTAYY